MNLKSLIVLAGSLLISCLLTAQNFTPAEKSLIMAGDTAKMMRVLIYTNDADLKVLNSESTDIDPSDPLLPLLARRMYKAMRDSANSGVGIAAPQVGINRNVIWVQRFDKSGSPFEFYINPRITKYSILNRKGGEGCLSVPEERGLLLRSYAILIEYQSFDGTRHHELIEDFTSVIFQHETDHLKGFLFPDRMREQQSAISLPLPQNVELFIRPQMVR
ncbi:MAG: peptide deformylase [Bacteroidales bacterium]|nr:peptide deformylase [Bacteroidales bacterium]